MQPICNHVVHNLDEGDKLLVVVWVVVVVPYSWEMLIVGEVVVSEVKV